MRIIIEIDEKGETAEVMEETESVMMTQEEATDAGSAPRSRLVLPEDSSGSEPPTAEISETIGEVTNAGSAPESLPEPTTDLETETSSHGQAIDAGAAPEVDRSSGGTTFKETEDQRSASTPTAKEGTNAGPPPASLQEQLSSVKGGETDYETIVSNNVDEVKERVEQGDLDVKKIIEAEQAGQARTTLLEWLERKDS